MFIILNFSELKKPKHDYATKLQCVTAYMHNFVFLSPTRQKKSWLQLESNVFYQLTVT